MPAALVTLAVVTLVHLLAQATVPGGVVADLTQVLLMPVLAWALVTSTPNPKSRLVRLVLLALTLSWLGDTLPRFAGDGSDLGFVLMLVTFLLAQLAYVAAFLPFVARSIVRTRPLLLLPGKRALVPTGIAIALPHGYAAFVHPRSGLAARHGLTVLNAPGTVDAGYRGEILVNLLNTDQRESVRLARGERIAQLVVQPVVAPVFEEVVELPASERGGGGHGHTGTGPPTGASPYLLTDPKD